MRRSVPYPRWTWLFWAVVMPLALTLLGGVAVVLSDAKDLPFDNAHLWWLVAAIPCAGLLLLYGVFRRRRALAAYASAELAPLLVPHLSPTRQAVRAGMVVAALVALVAAILGPRWGMYLEKQKVRGIDIVTVLDVSRSMLAADVRPNRLRAAKEQLRQQLTERAVLRGANRLALMAFSGSTSLRLPLTTDHIAFRAKLEEVRVGSAPRGGTAIGRAITNATDLFARSPEEATKIILLITDGEDHEGGGVDAARAAYEEHNIRTFTVGIGDPALSAGARVPAGNDGSGAGPAKPLLHGGQIVFSKLDVAGLKQIAEAGHGRYASLDDLSRLVEAVANMRSVELGAEERMRHIPRYQFFLLVAVLLLALEPAVGERRTGAVSETHRVWELERVG